jgi:hypothetical protein
MKNAIEITAIDKMIKTASGKEARNLLSVGTHPVDCLVRVKGTIKVGEDFEKKQTNKLDWIGLCALALSKLNGVTVESLIAEFEANGVDGKTIKKQAQEKIDALRDTTWQTTKGAVTTQLNYTIEAVEEATEATEATTETIEV